jgi:hypothetical protein
MMGVSDIHLVYADNKVVVLSLSITHQIFEDQNQNVHRMKDEIGRERVADDSDYGEKKDHVSEFDFGVDDNDDDFVEED